MMLVCSSSSTSSKQIVFRKGLDIAPALVFENTCIADTGLLLTKKQVEYSIDHIDAITYISTN